MDEKRLNAFMMEVLHHERVNALLPVYIHRDIFLDYDKIIDIYASKYPRRVPKLPSYKNQSIDLQSKSIDWFLYDGNLLLINPQSEN